MTVYIQALHQFPVAEWGVAALLGFKQMGTKIRFYETIDEVPLNSDVLVIGFADDTRRWFIEMGITPPNLPTLPEELDYFAGRAIQRTTLSDALAKTSFTFLIKPYSCHKQFDAQLIDQTEDIHRLLGQFPTDSMVLVSEPIVIQAEYRAFVINQVWVGLKHYKGAFRLFPSADIIHQTIRAYTSSSVAYAIDFGVTPDNRTVVIEVNDFWSLDNFGLDASLYARGLSLRWHQILT